VDGVAPENAEMGNTRPKVRGGEEVVERREEQASIWGIRKRQNSQDDAKWKEEYPLKCWVSTDGSRKSLENS